MKNKRGIKELLQLLLDNIDLLKSGLCDLTNLLFIKSKISLQEQIRLLNYLRKNKPLFSKRYWFPVGKKNLE